MAHLHVVAIHPFRDGNGRAARIAQSLVLAREGLVSFEFASIEEVEDRGWPDRMVIALEQSLVAETERTRYLREADISPATASADLRRLVDAGLVDQRGRGPSSRYIAAGPLRREIG